jgi:HTH-type transcriptional regulator/antitoxin HigA
MPSKYKALTDRHPLRPIKTEEELDGALEVARELYLNLNSLNDDEEDYLDVLSTLITQYEKVHHTREGNFTPIENVKYLFEMNNLKQSDFGKLLSLPSGRASEIWNGHRDLTKTHIAILAERFCVNATLFLPKVVVPILATQNLDTKIANKVLSKIKKALEPLEPEQRHIVLESLGQYKENQDKSK